PPPPSPPPPPPSHPPSHPLPSAPSQGATGRKVPSRSRRENEVIVLDDLKEEPDDSPAVIADLKSQLEKEKMMKQKACRATREAELRAERAEALLDSKYAIVEQVRSQQENREARDRELAALRAELDELKRTMEADKRRNGERSEEGEAGEEPEPMDAGLDLIDDQVEDCAAATATSVPVSPLCTSGKESKGRIHRHGGQRRCNDGGGRNGRWRRKEKGEEKEEQKKYFGRSR
ncbi:hypothetical protein PRIPAC_71013, partial [Pristionchus pacificus]